MNSSKPILKIDQLPIQQNRVYRSKDSAIDCSKGDIWLAQDANTGVVYNSAFDSTLMVYGEDYQNEQGCSGFFQQHLSMVGDIVKKYAGLGRIVEVGCGKGTFLEYLRSGGLDVVGVDPAYEGNAEYVIKSAFSRDVGLSGDLIVLRHVLEHIPDPLAFLESIARANDNCGLIYIEVPCLEWIKDNQAWFDIFYEHVNYFRLKDFERFFGKIVESGRLFGNQYIYVVADLSSLMSSLDNTKDEFSLGDGFMAGIDQVLSILNEDENRQVVIWGGASKGVILAQHVQCKSRKFFSFAIDISPAKQGGFFPGTGLPVYSPDEGLRKMTEGDVILIMNSNYADEIKMMAGDRFSYVMADAVFTKKL